MLRDIRKQYEFSALNECDVPINPFEQFEVWLKQAIESEQLEPTAMVLSTVDKLQHSHSRVVLLKELTATGLLFFTNYEGNKSMQIAQNNSVSLVFFWPSLERQVRIEGIVEKIPEVDSIAYFQSRPLDSQLGAWASPQSKPIPSHDFLDDGFKFYQDKFGSIVPKPPHWGGFIVIPSLFEFWQGRANRLHDRLQFKKNGEAWQLTRLAP